MVKKKGFKKELEDLAKILSGEFQLRMNQEKVERLKIKAIEKQKNDRRKKIVKGEEVLKKEDPSERKVVQNIKLYKWEAPIRFEIPFNIKTFFIIVAVCLIFILFLAILGHYALMVAIIALLFFIYAAGTTEPVNVTHVVTARGIETMGTLYEWFMLDEFYFTIKGGQTLLTVTTKLRVPSCLMMLVSEKDRAPLFILLQDKLLYKDIKKQSRLDVLNYGNYIPLEKI